MRFSRIARARPILYTAALAGFLVQFKWALHHGYATLPWRWLATAAAVALLLAPLLLVRRRLAGEARVRWEAGLRFLPALGFLGLIAFVSNGRNRLAVAVFCIVWFLFLLRRHVLPHRRGGALTWLLRATAGGAMLYAALAPAPLDGVTLHLTGPLYADYYWASREAPATDAEWGGGGTFRSETKRDVVTVPVGIPATREATGVLRVGLGALAETAVLRSLSLDSSLLVWNFPLATLGAEALLERGMTPVAGSIERQGSELVVRTARRRGTEVQFPLAAVRPLAAGNLPRQALFRGLWVLLIAMLLWAARGAAQIETAAWFRPWLGLGRNLLSPPQAPPESLRAYYRAHFAWIAAGVALLLALLFLRTGPNLLHPGLYVEDANFCFSYFYGGERPFSDSFAKLNKYMSLVYSYAWLVAKADVLWQPTLYLGATVAVSLAAASLLSFSGLLRERLTLLFAPTVLGLSGFVHVFLWITLVYQMYVTVLCLVVLLLFPPPETRTGAAVQALALAYFVWAAPYSVVAVPLALLLLVLRLYPGRRKVAMLAYAIVCTLLYYQTLQGGTTKPFALFSSPEMMEHYFVLLFEKVVLLDVFGGYAHWKLIVAAAAVTGLTWLLRRDKLYLKVSFALWCTMLAGNAVYFLTDKYEPYVTLPHLQQVSLYCWWLYLLISLDRALPALRVPRHYALAAWALVLGVVAYDNVQHPDKRAYPLHTSIPVFLKTVKELEPQKEALIARNEVLYVWTNGLYGKGPMEDRDWSPLARIGSRRPDARQTEIYIPFEVAR